MTTDEAPLTAETETEASSARVFGSSSKARHSPREGETTPVSWNEQDCARVGGGGDAGYSEPSTQQQQQQQQQQNK